MRQTGLSRMALAAGQVSVASQWPFLAQRCQSDRRGRRALRASERSERREEIDAINA
jgi:hypothetical protein